jgi:hypothetical protein
LDEAAKTIIDLRRRAKLRLSRDEEAADIVVTNNVAGTDDHGRGRSENHFKPSNNDANGATSMRKQPRGSAPTEGDGLCQRDLFVVTAEHPVG